ncbi:MAG: GNAT family N-acetyltransferase [Pseudomonadota bacterium]
MMSHLVEVPELETERLRLRLPLHAEFSTYRDLFGSSRARFMGELDELRAWREFAAEIGLWALFGYGPWHVLRKKDGALLGAVAVLKHVEQPEIELGWHLYDGHEGNGYITEAATVARDWAFETHGFKSLVSYIDRDNARSIAVAERLGATEDKTAQKVDPEDVVYRHNRVMQ